MENLPNRIKVNFPYLTPTQGSHQREGMGLLEYQAMPSLRDAAHDGVLCTFSNKSAPDRDKWFGPSGQAAWTVHHVYLLLIYLLFIWGGTYGGGMQYTYIPPPTGYMNNNASQNRTI